MKNLNETLSEVLDVDPIVYDDPVVVPTSPAPVVVVEEAKKTEVVAPTDADVDADFARKNIKSLIEKGNVAVDNILQVAAASEHPRAYEVAAGLIKNLADLNKDLMEIQKRKRDLGPKETQGAGTTTNIDKAVFVGSFTDLVKSIKNNK